MSLEWNIQAAVYSALTGNAALVTLATGGIHDHVIPTNTNPYVVIGETVAEDWDTKTENGQELLMTFHIWSQEEGRKETKQIMDAIYDVLHKQRLTITGGVHVVTLYEFSDTVVDPDGTTRHGVARYKLIVEEV